MEPQACERLMLKRLGATRIALQSVSLFATTAIISYCSFSDGSYIPCNYALLHPSSPAGLACTYHLAAYKRGDLLFTVIVQCCMLLLFP